MYGVQTGGEKGLKICLFCVHTVWISLMSVNLDFYASLQEESGNSCLSSHFLLASVGAQHTHSHILYPTVALILNHNDLHVRKLTCGHTPRLLPNNRASSRTIRGVPTF